MKKKIDAVQLQRSIRAKLSGKFAKSRKAELHELRNKFGRLHRQKTGGR